MLNIQHWQKHNLYKVEFTSYSSLSLLQYCWDEKKNIIISRLSKYPVQILMLCSSWDIDLVSAAFQMIRYRNNERLLYLYYEYDRIIPYETSKQECMGIISSPLIAVLCGQYRGSGIPQSRSSETKYYSMLNTAHENRPFSEIFLLQGLVCVV